LDAAKTSLNENDRKIFLHDKYATFSYCKILQLSQKLSSEIQNSLGKSDLKSQKIGVYCANNYTYLISILAIWMLNGVPFCLSKLYPSKFMEYFLNDSDCKLVINSQENKASLTKEFDSILKRENIINLKLVESEFYNYNLSDFQSKNVSQNYENLIDQLCRDKKNKEAFLLYTSGTSGPPKVREFVFDFDIRYHNINLITNIF
jgi:long-subunit acyl-CoA synthetase (AMP-forming)